MTTNEIAHNEYNETYNALNGMMKLDIANNIEVWNARDIMEYLQYSEWYYFKPLIERAMIACNNSGLLVEYHFKPIIVQSTYGKGAVRNLEDYLLTRAACYFVCMEADPRKKTVAYAKQYFVSSTIANENMFDDKLSEYYRNTGYREELRDNNRELNHIVYRNGYGGEMGIMRDEGYRRFFDHNTQEMKQRYNVPENRVLPDFLPSLFLSFLNAAAELTVTEVKMKDMTTKDEIFNEYFDNNSIMREVLLRKGIKPEDLPPAEDYRTLKKYANRKEKQMIKGSNNFPLLIDESNNNGSEE